MQTTRKLVLSRETVRRLAVQERAERPTGSVNDSCNQTLCTTESGCFAAKKA